MTEELPDSEALFFVWEMTDPVVTREMAERIREWRVVMGQPWEWIGRKAVVTWPERWEFRAHPRLVGCAICQTAAHYFGEFHARPPWN